MSNAENRRADQMLQLLEQVVQRLPDMNITLCVISLLTLCFLCTYVSNILALVTISLGLDCLVKRGHKWLPKPRRDNVR